MLHSALRIRQVRNAQDKASEKPTDASIPPAPDEPLSDHDLDDDDLIIEPLRESNDYRRLLFQNSISTNSVYLTTSENTWLAKSYRTMVLRWVFQVCDAMGFFDETVFCAVSMFDRVTEQYNVEKCHLQLFGATCLWIAAKIEESVTPALSDFIYLCSDVYRDREFHECEAVVLRTLHFSVAVSSPVFFLKGVLMRQDDRGLACAAMFFARAATFSVWYSAMQPHVVAYSALFLGSLVVEAGCTLEADDPRAQPDEMLVCVKRILEAAADIRGDVDNNLYEEFVKAMIADNRSFSGIDFDALSDFVVRENVESFC